MSLAALVIVRSGRSTLPATHHPSAIEMTPMIASAITDTNASTLRSALR